LNLLLVCSLFLSNWLRRKCAQDYICHAIGRGVQPGASLVHGKHTTHSQIDGLQNLLTSRLMQERPNNDTVVPAKEPEFTNPNPELTTKSNGKGSYPASRKASRGFLGNILGV
jgi:hypothetical protein